jgi:hypothetical protein
MRSLELSLDKYDSDKLHYLKIYDPIFEPYVQKKIALLELGVLKGGSLLLWRDYFPFGPEASSLNFQRSLKYGLGVLKTSLQFRLQKWGLWFSPIFTK